MKQGFILLTAIVVVFVAPSVQGTAHLQFVTNMTANVTRTGCGTDKLCVETPDDCDPATNNTCLFISVNGTAGVAPNGTTLSFQLSGANNTGDFFIAAALTANASEGNSTVFICGRNQTTNSTIGVNGTFFFRTMLRNNTDGMLSPTETNVTGIKNLTTSNRIQCEFEVRLNNTNFVVLLGSGNVTGMTLGNLTINVTSNTALNLTDPASNLNNTNTTTSSVNITRTGCGTEKLCVETPEDCDPETNSTCLFASVNGTAGVAPNGATLNFELSLGNRSGDIFIGVALTANASEGTSMLYVCGRNSTNNGNNVTFFFRKVQRNNTNGSLTIMNTTATGIRNSTSNTTIQCVFTISGVNATARGRRADTTFVVLLGTGTVNGSTLVNFTANVTTPPLNLIDPASNLNNNNTTIPPLNVNRTGCGTGKLCLETPDDCDPATNNSCLFVSARVSGQVTTNSTPLTIELSGANNTGTRYVGLALTIQGTTTLYVCGRNSTNNGTNVTFFFRTVQINNNGVLTVLNTTATGIRNSTSDIKIQCEFTFVVNLSTTRNRNALSSTIQLGSGTVNGSDLGNFTANVTAVVDLTNPASNLNNTNTTSLNITRTGCGTDKLCVETPEDCDPATNNSCLFTSVDGTAGVAPNGTTLSFELSGANRTGDRYIGVALTANASEGTSMLYVCGRNGTTNGTVTFFFLTVQRNNTNEALTIVNTTATGIQNLTTETKIQCVFNISGVNATARPRSADTTFVVILGSGTVNGSTLGNFVPNVTTAALNLLDPASNLNTTTATTVPPTSGANNALFPQALPLLLSIFILSILKTA